MTGFPFEEAHRDPFCYVGVTVFRISVLVPKTYPRYLARAKKARYWHRIMRFDARPKSIVETSHPNVLAIF